MVGTIQNLAMANGDGGGGGPGAARTPVAVTRRRRLIALVVSLLATAAVTVPLSYQAHAARATIGRAPLSVPTVPSTTMIRRDPSTDVLPTTTINTTPQLRWARSIDDTSPAALDGATLDDNVVVWVDADDALRVEFWIDPGTRIRRPVSIAEVAPFTLSDPDPATPGRFDTRHLGNGEHAIEILVVRRNGAHVRMLSRFVVANR